MASICSFPNAVQVLLEPGEILHLRAYKPPQEGTPSIADVIRATAWVLLYKHGQKVMKNRQFKYGDVEFINGKLSVMFFEDIPEINNEPGGP